MPVVGELLQVGVLFLVAVLTYVAWQQVNATMEAAERSEQLSAEIVAVNRNLEMQRALYETLAKSTAEIRKLRHDMRHQLSAIKGMMADGRPEEAEDYIDTLYDAIPTLSNKIICDNHALNALASHYLAIATEAGIQCDLHMDVPKKVGRILDNDLCVIVGNLFENAIEACGHVEPDKRFIKLMTKVEGPRLILTLDNSYDGQLKVRNGEFYSRKRGMTTRGIGIQSVKSEVLKYDGAMKYEAEDEVFKTSLYVKL
jgi:sensor histidine kinase regulating citrate/malate metabolism